MTRLDLRSNHPDHLSSMPLHRRRSIGKGPMISFPNLHNSVALISILKEILHESVRLIRAFDGCNGTIVDSEANSSHISHDDCKGFADLSPILHESVCLIRALNDCNGFTKPSILNPIPNQFVWFHRATFDSEANSSVRLIALSKMLLLSRLPRSKSVYVWTSLSIVCFRCSFRTLSMERIFFKSASLSVFARTAPSQEIGRARTLLWSETMLIVSTNNNFVSDIITGAVQCAMSDEDRTWMRATDLSYSFSHQHSRVRYYACETLYNIAKIRIE